MSEASQAGPAPADLSAAAAVESDESSGKTRPIGRSVRGYLTLFTIALVLPILLFTGFVLGRYAVIERARLEREASDLAQAVAVALDRDLTGLFASLDVMVTSSALAQRDYPAFRRQALELQARSGITTVLLDLSGQQLVNTRLPEDGPLPRSTVRWSREQYGDGNFVTDMIVGQVTGQRQFLVGAPVRGQQGVEHVIYFSLPLSRLQGILADLEIPRAYTVSIVDRQGVILARNTRAEEFAGQLASEDLRNSAFGSRGTWSGTTVDGTPVHGAYSRSRLSGFRAAAGIRYADLNAPLWRSLSLFALLGLAILALSSLLGLHFARRITSPIGALAREAARLGKGQPVEPLSTGLREADQVGAQLAAASERRREREAQLRNANEELQRFAYIVSHDLRSPLVNIMGFTTELEALRADLFGRLTEARGALDTAEASKDGELGREFDEAIGFIKASIGKMDRLINAILRLSREGRRTLEPSRVDMDELIAGIRASLATQTEAAGATVTAGKLPGLISDRLALEQVFTNLLDNALKYLRDGVPGRVDVSGRAQGSQLVYEVRDNGRGVDARDAERIFELFRRSGVQDRPGEGIGLAHVRALVRRLGGTITLTSNPGQGSTFTVTLPRRWAGERGRETA